MSTLTDEQWALVAPLFPPPSPYDRNHGCGCNHSCGCGRGRGRPSLDQTDPGHNRRVLDAILYKLRERLPWYDLPVGPPAYFPPWPTCYRRYRRWQKDGILDKVFATLFLHLRHIGELDLVDALHSGRLAIHRQDGRLLLQATDPALQGTWQLDVARLFFALALQKNFAFFKSKILRP